MQRRGDFLRFFAQDLFEKFLLLALDHPLAEVCVGIEAEGLFRGDPAPGSMLLLQIALSFHFAEIIADGGRAKRLKSILLERMGADRLAAFQIQLDQPEQDGLFPVGFGELLRWEDLLNGSLHKVLLIPGLDYTKLYASKQVF